MSYEEILDEFSELYGELPSMLRNKDYEDHPAWKKLEDELGGQVTMDDLSQHWYLHYK